MLYATTNNLLASVVLGMIILEVMILAVLVEALSVVVRCEAIVKKYSGGADAFMSAIPNKTLCSD